MAPIPCRLATLPDDFRLLNISPTRIETKEDAMRTMPFESGIWEWWYFDAHLENGAKLVVVFFTKDFAKPNTGVNPRIMLQLETPDGHSRDVTRVFAPGAFTASKEKCDVRMTGKGEDDENYFRGTDLRNYEIRAHVKDVDVDVRLTSTVQPWRPSTGHILYGKENDQYFAWLPSVPYGNVTVTYRVQGVEPVTVEGHGYHDHNWGNVSLARVVNHWYWGRGIVGPYTFISASIYNEEKYGNKEVVVFMLQRDGAVVADDNSKVTFSARDIEIDAETRRPVANTVQFEYKDGAKRYSLEYVREKTILRKHLIKSFKGLLWLLAKLVGFDGCYVRFTGTLKLKVYENEALVEEHESDALWELMWFGAVRNQNIPYIQS